MTSVKRGVLICLAVLPLFSLSSCRSYRDIDNVVFVTSVLIDKGEDNKFVYYFETLNSTRSSAKEGNAEQRIVYKITAENTGEAYRQLETYNSAPATFSHNKVLMFSMNLAKSGIGGVFDFFQRWVGSNGRTILAVYDGDPQGFVKPNHPEESNTGLFLYDLLGEGESLTSIGVRNDINSFVTQEYLGDRVRALPVIAVGDQEEQSSQQNENRQIEQNQNQRSQDWGNQPNQSRQSQSSQSQSSQNQSGQGQSGQNQQGKSQGQQAEGETGSGGGENMQGQYKLRGLALIKMDKMIGELDRDQATDFNLMINNQVSGILNIRPSEVKGFSVSLLLEKFNYDSEVHLEKNILRAKRSITLHTSLTEFEGEKELEEETIREIESVFEKKLREDFLKLFQEWKAKKTDIFNLQEEFERKYPEQKGRNIIVDTELDIEVKVKVDGSMTLMPPQ